MVYDVRYVAIGRVFTLYELWLSSSYVRGVLFECAIGPVCVAYGSNDVWFVVGGSVLCWENVFRYDMWGLFVCGFVLLKTFLFRLCDRGEFGGGRVFCRGCVLTEVNDWLFT